MKRSNWVRLIAVILVISMMAAPVSAVPNRSKDNANAKGMIDLIKDVTEDISDGLFDDSDDETSIDQNKAGKAKPGKPEKPSKPEKPEKPSKPEKPEKPSKPEKPEKPSKPEKPTEPVETEPTVPSEPEVTEPTVPSEPEVTEPTEPVEDSPEYELNLVEGHANTENGHLLRGVTYTLSQVISQQSEPQVAPYALRSTKSSALALNAASAYAVQPMAEGDIQTMATVDITDGLVAHYDFETVNGTTVTSNVTTNTTAELKNGASVDENGYIGNAMKLESNEHGMQLTNTVNANETSFSISMWYKLNSTSTVNVNLAQAGTIGGDSGRTILILQPNSTYKSYLTANNAVVTTDSVERTEWQHITFVYDKDNSKGYFYINGEADNADGVDMGSTAPVSTSDMIIGRHRSAEGVCDGLIDEVRIYNKVLSAEEAAAVYNYGSTQEPVVDPSDSTRDIPVSVLTATAGNSQTNQGPENTLDGNDDTLWHTSWDGSSRDTHWIQFQLSADYNVDGLRYRPRQGSGDGSDNGLITEYKIQVSDDGENFRDVVSGNWENDRDWKIAQFESENVKYVRLVVINAQSNSTTKLYASAAEIRLTGERVTAPSEPEQPAIGSELVFFPVTMFNYDHNVLDAATDAMDDDLTVRDGLYFTGAGIGFTAPVYETITDKSAFVAGQYYIQNIRASENRTDGAVWLQAHENNKIYAETQEKATIWNLVVEGDLYYLTCDINGVTNYMVVGTNGDTDGYTTDKTAIEIVSYSRNEEGVQLKQGDYYLCQWGGNAVQDFGGYDRNNDTGNGMRFYAVDAENNVSDTPTTIQTVVTDVQIGGTKPHNRWAYFSDDNNAQNMFYSGLVEENLVNDQIQFTVNEPGIFTFDKSDPTKTSDGLKDIYQYVGLPFIKNEKGYYTFNSDAHGTYFADTTGDGVSDPWYGAADDYFNMYFDYENTQTYSGISGDNGDGSSNLWMPYNINDDSITRDSVDYHFGMRADIPFSMTPNGRIDSYNDESLPITFTFAGDDDVWIFIDGQLVIDLGGIHNRIGATIDFANNTITYFRPESNTNTLPIGSFTNPEEFPLNDDGTITVKLYDDVDGVGALGQTRADFSTEMHHQMSIFYLERGKGTANCHIEFNLPMLDTVLVTKDITKSWSARQDELDGDDGDGTADLTAKEQAVVDTHDFKFRLWKKEPYGRFTPVVNTRYYLQDKDGNILPGNNSTNSEGIFSLKNGQTAKFLTDLGNGTVTYAVEELELDLNTYLTPDYKYAGTAANGFDFFGETLNNETEDENDTKTVQEHLTDPSLIGEQELPMNAVELKSYEVTPYGSIEAIESLEFICTNYLNADLPNPTARAYEDIIVIDYGLPVQVDPLHNDLFRGDNIEIVAWGDETLELNEVLESNQIYAVPYGTEGGTSWSGDKFMTVAEQGNTGEVPFDSGNVTFNDVTYAEHEHVKTNEDGSTTKTYTYTRDSFEYELTKQLTEVEEIRYIIKVTSTQTNETTCRYALGKVYIVPATIMYYEENFSGLVSYSGTGNWSGKVPNSTLDSVTGEYPQLGEQREEQYVSEYQEPGVVGTVDDSTYGSDKAYLKDSHDSNGTSFRFDTTNGFVRFQYTFTGTGTTFFARTSATTGYMQVLLFKGDKVGASGEQIDTYYRDTYFYKGDDDYTKVHDDEPLYNIPVYTNDDLDYGTYTVLVTVAKKGTKAAGPIDPTRNGMNYSMHEFYLDGIRVMQPLNGVLEISEETGECEQIPYDQLDAISKKAVDAYATDGESNLDVVTLRHKILDDYTFENDDEIVVPGDENVEVDGEESDESEANWPFVVMTDTNKQIIKASEYESIGPKEEVYLSAQDTNAGISNAQTVSFSLMYWQPQGLNLYMGMKAPFGSATVNVGNESVPLLNATDCYYDVTDDYESLITVYEQQCDKDGQLLYTDPNGDQVYEADDGFYYVNDKTPVEGGTKLTRVYDRTKPLYNVVTYTFKATENIVSLTNIKVVGSYKFTILENPEIIIPGDEIPSEEGME